MQVHEVQKTPSSVRQARVLVVDDTHINRVLLRRGLDQAGYLTLVAEDGAQALAQLEEQRPDLVILDIVLPDISGVEVLRAIRARFSTAELPVIMASGLGRDDDIVQALDIGANDYVVKPLNMTVVMARVRVQLAVMALQMDLADRNQELKTARDRMQADLDAAARIQRALLPRVLPQDSSWWYASQYLPCSAVGGDVYNVIDLGEQRRAVYLIDVSGHGVPAALLAVSLCHLLARGSDLLNALGQTPELIAQRLNERFQISRANLQYFTMIFGILDEEHGTFTFVQAGHPPPLLVRANGKVERAETMGMPIGLMPSPAFPSQILQLEPGDRLLFYSDGITEAENAQGKAFGMRQLERIVRLTRSLPLPQAVERILGDLHLFVGNQPQADDWTFLALEMKV